MSQWTSVPAYAQSAWPMPADELTALAKRAPGMRPLGCSLDHECRRRGVAGSALGVVSVEGPAAGEFS